MTGRIHDRYLFRQFIRIFLISVFAFTTIYITVNTFEELDNFIDHQATLRNVARYYLYSLPYILTYIVPVSLLLGTIFSMGVMARRNELTAFIASGISLFRVARPIIVTAVIISIGSIFFNDHVVTRATRKSKDVKHHDIEGRSRPDPYLKENLHYLGENGFVYLAKRYDNNTKTMWEVVVQQFDGHTLARRIDARRARWNGEQWVFYDGFDRVFSGGTERVRAFDEFSIPALKETPDVFAKKEVSPEYMDFGELREYVDKVRRSGGDTERYLTDMYFKFSYPIAGSIFVLLGIAFASGKRKRSIATGFGLTLLIAFLYYGALRIGQTLGYNGVMPPLLAAELGNLLFFIVGTSFLVRANN